MITVRILKEQMSEYAPGSLIGSMMINDKLKQAGVPVRGSVLWGGVSRGKLNLSDDSEYLILEWEDDAPASL